METPPGRRTGSGRSHGVRPAVLRLLNSGSVTWHARPMRNRKVALVCVVVMVWAVVTPFMWRDLQGRTPEQLRGPKWLWWIASFNLSGSAAYWLCGRRVSR